MKSYKKIIAITFSFILVSLTVFNTYLIKASASKLTTTKIDLAINQTKKITIKNRNKKATYTYHIDNNKVATVNKSGEVKGLKKGITTITVKSVVKKKVNIIGTIKVIVRTNAKPISDKFVMGINLFGDAVTIDGNAWRSYNDALTKGFSTTATNTFMSDLTWSPTVDKDTNTMLNSVIYNSNKSFTMTQNIANGSYKVYFWIAENYQDEARSLDIKLEGNTVASGVASMKKNFFVKYGPYNAKVSDGKLDMEFVNVKGDPHCAGLAIYSSDANSVPVVNNTPTVTKTPASMPNSSPSNNPIPTTAPGSKNRVIITTDIGSDPDDEQSMVRTLLYSNDLDIEGLIATTGCWKPTTGNNEINMIKKIINAYGKVRSNLNVHAKGYPTEDYLLSILKLGQTSYGMAGIGNGKDSEGSKLIIDAVDKDDSRPVWVTAWGGTSCIAQALWKVQNTRTPVEVAKFVSKLRIYDIGGQDDTGAWMAKSFPDLFYICSVGQFYGMGTQGDTSLVDKKWLKENIQSHGPLGAVYPDVAWTMEGDTPTFLNLIPNGLCDPAIVDQGGWGGRFYSVKKLNPRSTQDNGKVAAAQTKYDNYYMFSDATDDGNSQKPIFRWRVGYQNDMAARMDWSMKSSYTDANHNPIAIVNNSTNNEILQITAAAGSSVKLSAAGSNDPEGNKLIYAWSYYKEASSYVGIVPIQNNAAEAATVLIPSNASGKNIHVILQINDDGTPNLYAYRRVIINVK